MWTLWLKWLRFHLDFNYEYRLTCVYEKVLEHRWPYTNEIQILNFKILPISLDFSVHLFSTLQTIIKFKKKLSFTWWNPLSEIISIFNYCKVYIVPQLLILSINTVHFNNYLCECSHTTFQTFFNFGTFYKYERKKCTSISC